MEQAVAVVKPKWLALGAVAVLLGLVLRVAWVTEDAFITLRTVDNWFHGYGLRWNIDERVQSYTHPLWMFMLSAAYFVTREVFMTTIAVGVLTTLAALLVLVHFARSAGHAVAAVVLLTMSHGFIDFSTSGLENPLSHLLLATFVGLYAVRSAPLWQLALTAALLMGSRMDAILLVGPALLHASILELRAVGWKPTLRSLLIGLSPLLAWEAFSLFYYGVPFPNTAYAKLNTGIPRAELVRQGFVYWLAGLAWDVPLHVIALAGVVVACLQRRQRDLAIALGILLYTLYVINIGGDFMQGRFWTLPFFTGACLIAISSLPLEDPLRAAAVALPFGFFLLHPLAQEVLTREFFINGVADERAIFREGMSLVLQTRTREMPTHVWARDGHALAERKEKVAVHENVGLMGFTAGPGVHLVDALALTDPLLARLPMRYDPNWRVGHYVRQLPSGYVETIRDGKCRMKDKRLCEYYGHLHEVISGPLFSFSRLGTILALNLGRYDHLIDVTRYRDPKVGHAVLDELTDPVAELAAWDSTGTLQMPPAGMTIDLPGASHAARIEGMFDGNDGYTLKFLLGKKVIAETTSPALPQGLMRNRSIDVPEAARTQGFDQLVVFPFGGDGMYSIGFLRLHDR